MAFWDPLYKEIGRSGILNQTKDQSELIEGVLFDIWMRGHLERNPLQSAGVPLASMVVAFFLTILTLPYGLAKRLPAIAFSALVAGVVYLGWSSSSIAASVFILSLIFLCKDGFLSFFKKFFYDVADVFLLGRLTARKLEVLRACGPIKHFQGEGFLVHLFVSRTLTSGALAKEAEAFQESVRLLKDDWSLLYDLIEKYWEEGRCRKDYWSSQLFSISGF